MTHSNTPPGGDSTPGADTPAPVAATPSSELSLEQRVARIEALLETFFGTLATTATPNAADATAGAGEGTAAAGTPSARRVEERLRWLERAVLRVQLEVGANSAPGEPWDPDASADELIKRRTDAHAAERHWIVGMLERLRGQTLRLERDDDDDDAWLEIDALRARAERLARRLLLERDGEALRQRGVGAACWDAEGVLIGTGATADEAKQDAARRLGAAGVVSRLAAEVPQADLSDEFAWLDAVRDPRETDRAAEFERLGRWLVDRIGTLPPDEAEAASRQLDATLLAAGAPQVRAEALARRLLLERDAEALRRRGARAGCWDFEGRLIGAGATCGDALRDAVKRCGPEPRDVAWLTAELRDASGDE